MSFRSRTRAARRIFYVPGFPKGVKWLLISNVAIFILGYFAGLRCSWTGRWLIWRSFRLTSSKISPSGSWPPTLFLHGGFGHIIWNMLALWMFGADLEQDLGNAPLSFSSISSAAWARASAWCIANYVLPWGNPNDPHHRKLRRYFRHSAGLRDDVSGPRHSVGIPDSDQGEVFRDDRGRHRVSELPFGVNTGVSEFAHLGGLLFGYLFLKTPKVQFDPVAPIRRQYQDWKLQRAKKKFQVYLRKQGSGRGPKVH